MERKYRAGSIFSEHILTTKIFKCGDEEIRVDRLQKGSSHHDLVEFTNTANNMMVSGDYSNWVFNRPFIPRKDNLVSDYYWREKLIVGSEQKLDELDMEAIAEKVKEKISNLESDGYEEVELENLKEWWEGLLETCDDELEYKFQAYRDYDRPDCIDHENIPDCRKTPVHLLVVFDAWEEICSRIK